MDELVHMPGVCVLPGRAASPRAEGYTMAWRRAIGRLFCLGLAAIALIAGTVLSTPLWLGPLIGPAGPARVSVEEWQDDGEVTFTTKHETGRAGATRSIAEARGIYAGEPVVVHVAAGLPSDTQNPLQGWPVEIAVQNGPTQASVKGTLQEPFSLRGVIADFVIAGPDMALLRPLTDVPFPATPPYELRGKLDLA